MAGSRTVVIVVDVQADFTQQHIGALPVPGTDQGYLDDVLAATRAYVQDGNPVICTRDYHPESHISFCSSHPGKNPFDRICVGAVEQTLWPPHCVQMTPGAQILIPQEFVTRIIDKGTHPQWDSYSAFQDDGGKDTGLQELLAELGAQGLIIYGLATDYCVKMTALHALERGYHVRIRTDLCRGVTPEGAAESLEQLKRAGAVLE